MIVGCELRWGVYTLMRGWGLSASNSIYTATYALIRGDAENSHDSYSDENVTKKDVRVFKLLLSDNGYAVYKMLLARRGDDAST